MTISKCCLAIAALNLLTVPALADCKARLSEIEAFIQSSATGAIASTTATKPSAQAGQSAAVPGSQDTQSGPKAGAPSSTAAPAGTNSQGNVAPGKAAGVQGSTDTQSGAASMTVPATGQDTSGKSSKMTDANTSKTVETGAATNSAKMTGSSSAPDMGTARSHLDLARAALTAGNESDCAKAADQAAEAAGMPK